MSNLIAGHGDCPRGWDIQTAKQIEQGGLAGPAGPHEGNKVALIHVEVEALEYLDLLLAASVCFVEAPDLDQGAGTAVNIDAGHLLLLLPDFNLHSVFQILRTVHHNLISWVDAGHDLNSLRCRPPQCNGPAFDPSVAHGEDIRLCPGTSYGGLRNNSSHSRCLRSGFPGRISFAQKRHFHAHIRKDFGVKFVE